jgi:hypothetical protein
MSLVASLLPARSDHDFTASAIVTAARTAVRGDAGGRPLVERPPVVIIRQCFGGTQAYGFERCDRKSARILDDWRSIEHSE